MHKHYAFTLKYMNFWTSSLSPSHQGLLNVNSITRGACRENFFFYTLDEVRLEVSRSQTVKRRLKKYSKRELKFLITLMSKADVLNVIMDFHQVNANTLELLLRAQTSFLTLWYFKLILNQKIVGL